MKMEQTECSETSAYKLQTPGKYPKESIQITFYVTQWIRDFCEKRCTFTCPRGSPQSLRNPKINYRVCNSLQLNPITRQINPIHILPLPLYKKHFSIRKQTAKKQILSSSRLPVKSVCPQGTTRLSQDGFSWRSTSGISTKHCRIISIPVKIGVINIHFIIVY